MATPTSTAEKLEQKISKFLRRWLGLSPAFPNNGLYLHSTKPQMPISSLVKEYTVTKARLLLTLRHSADEKTSDADIQART